MSREVVQRNYVALAGTRAAGLLADASDTLFHLAEALRKWNGDEDEAARRFDALREECDDLNATLKALAAEPEQFDT